MRCWDHWPYKKYIKANEKKTLSLWYLKVKFFISLAQFQNSEIHTFYNLQNNNNINNMLFAVLWILNRKDMEGIIEVGQKCAQMD